MSLRCFQHTFSVKSTKSVEGKIIDVATTSDLRSSSLRKLQNSELTFNLKFDVSIRFEV